MMIPVMVQALSAYRFSVVRDIIAEGEKLIVSPQSFVTRTASSQQLERTTSFYYYNFHFFMLNKQPKLNHCCLLSF